MKVNVSWKDIDNGIGGDDNKCALALAVKRAFNKGVDTTDVAVYYDNDIEEDEDKKILLIRVDNEYYSHSHIDKYDHLNNFIDWFDNGMLGEDGCEPFKFEIDTTRTTI